MGASDYFVEGEELIEKQDGRRGAERKKVRRSKSLSAGMAKYSVNAEAQKYGSKCVEQYRGQQDCGIRSQKWLIGINRASKFQIIGNGGPFLLG